MIPTRRSEAEAQRAFKAKRERNTRRATQGVTLDNIQKGKKLYAIVLKNRILLTLN